MMFSLMGKLPQTACLNHIIITSQVFLNISFQNQWIHWPVECLPKKPLGDIFNRLVFYPTNRSPKVKDIIPLSHDTKKVAFAQSRGGSTRTSFDIFTEGNYDSCQKYPSSHQLIHKLFLRLFCCSLMYLNLAQLISRQDPHYTVSHFQPV